MIGIWGMGGIGKTTLVLKIAEQAIKDSLFDAAVMATISQNPNLRAIQGQIADKLRLKLDQETDDGRADRLFLELQSKKKVLVILDDIWEKIELRDIGIPFEAQHQGCKVILTSRNLQVCESMESLKNFPVKILRDDEAADLFRSKAGHYDEVPEKVDLAKQIIKECGCLPLAIAIVAAGLRGQAIPHWEDMANRLKNSNLDRKVFECVQLSIKILPEESQRLFLLCSLFPEDYDIPIEKLWLYGLGLDFLKKVDDVEAALTRVEKLTSSLKSSCLLLEGFDKNWEVKMHDVVRDAALEIASKSDHVFLTKLKGEELSKQMAISFWPSDIKKVEFPDILVCPLLEILILNFPVSYSANTLSIHEDFFMGMNKLTVLEISGLEFKTMPRSLECLENLQALCFDNCVLGDISNVGRLKKLTVLCIHNSDLEVLPREIGQLTNLRVLTVRANDSSIVVEIGALQNLCNLEALSMSDSVEWEDIRNANIEELIALSDHLKILHICMPYVPLLTSQLPFENLSRFQVSVGYESRELYYYFRTRLYDYHTTLFLKGCDLSNIGVKKVMKKINFLSFRKMKGLDNILLSSNLHGGGVLKRLEVYESDEVEYIFSTKNWDVKSSFPPLQELVLWDLIRLKEIFHGSLMTTLSNLTRLEVDGCDQLQYIFPCSVVKSLCKLQTLRVVNCENLEVIIFGSEEETLMEVDLPQLSELWLRGLPKLKCLDSFSSIVQERLSGEEEVHCHSSEMNKYLQVEKYGGLFHGSLVTTLSNLTELKVDGCDQLQYIFTRTVAKTLSRIQALYISNCQNLEVIIYSSSEETLAEVDGNITFPHLTELILRKLPNLKSLESYFILKGSLLSEEAQRPSLEVNKSKEKSSSQIFSGFPKLRYLYVEDCGSFRGINGPHLTLPDSVEHFSLNCPSNEGVPLQVLATGPRLRVLRLVNLSKLQRIEWNTKTYQNLERLEVSGCTSLTSFFDDYTNALRFPYLWKLSMRNCHEMFQFASQSQEALKQDTVRPLFDQRVEFGALKSLTIDGLYNLEQVHAIEASPLLLFSHLEALKLSNLHSLKHLWWNDNVVKDGTHAGLPNLQELVLVNCGRLRFVFTPYVVAKHFRELRNVQISKCEMIEEIVTSNEHAGNLGDECEPHDRIILPSLVRLDLEDLDNLQGFYMGKSALELPQLDSMSIKGCSKMQIFCLGYLLTPQLKSIELDDKELHISNKNLNDMLMQEFHKNKAGGSDSLLPEREAELTTITEGKDNVGQQDKRKEGEDKRVIPVWRCLRYLITFTILIGISSKLITSRRKRREMLRK